MSEEHSAESQNPPHHMCVPENTEGRPCQSFGLPEYFLYKNRLQEYTQRSAMPLPIYQINNEGTHHAPKFRSTVVVDGASYMSPNTFSHRKPAEQEAARTALLGISQKAKDEGCPFIYEDAVFCKSILNEYAVKMNLERPTYHTIQPEGSLPVFLSSLVFNGVTYTGDVSRSKKVAEQMAARAVIISILGSKSGTVISEIIKSKFKLYSALHKVKDSLNTHNGIKLVGENSGSSFGVLSSKRKEIEVAGGSTNIPITAISEPYVEQSANIPAMHLPLHEFKKPKPEPSPETITTTIILVPPVMEQPLVVDSTSGKRQNCENKKNAEKNVQDDDQLPIAVLPLSQVPPCSAAQ